MKGDRGYGDSALLEAACAQARWSMAPPAERVTSGPPEEGKRVAPGKRSAARGMRLIRSRALEGR